ncbi:hypothetical protein V865_006330 [Kwoniella europaea PYCC6329]|uniref:Uncharacterized protein n=1 Tax=Kwoniella europaea PYCC6329 TaxID=1423913 RepID=A0AAX4KQG9_9TREE
MTSNLNNVIPTWTVSSKSTQDSYETTVLPDTVFLATCAERKEETSEGWKKRYILRAYDENSRNQYTWEGYESDLKRHLSQGTNGRSKEIMASAAEDLNLFGDKQTSERESFVTSSNKSVTWWSESKEGYDEKARYRYEVVDPKGRKRAESLSMARLEDKAKYSNVASTILAKVKGVEASMAPEGNVDVGDSMIFWKTSPVTDTSGKYGYMIKKTEKGHTQAKKAWMSLEDMEKNSKSEQHGDEWKLVLDDITRKLGGATSVVSVDSTRATLSSSTSSGA